MEEQRMLAEKDLYKDDCHTLAAYSLVHVDSIHQYGIYTFMTPAGKCMVVFPRLPIDTVDWFETDDLQLTSLAELQGFPELQSDLRRLARGLGLSLFEAIQDFDPDAVYVRCRFNDWQPSLQPPRSTR